MPAKSRTYHFPCRVKKPPNDSDVNYMDMVSLEIWYYIFTFLDPVIDLPKASCMSVNVNAHHVKVLG